MRPEAIAAWTEVATGPCGNPSGAHVAARAARRILDDARDVVAEALGARPGEVVFTAGGTEADNLAVLGSCRARGGTALCSAVEHHAVLHSVEAVGGRTVGVDARGALDLDRLAAALEGDIAVVSVMTANNESGIVADLDPVAEIVHRHAPGAAVHTDAVQAVAWVDTRGGLRPRRVDRHLGPQVRWSPGGRRARGARWPRRRPAAARWGPGTQSGAAAPRTSPASQRWPLPSKRRCAPRTSTVARVGALRDRLVDGLVAAVPGVAESGVDGADRSHKVASVAHLLFDGIESEALLFLLERGGVLRRPRQARVRAGAQEPSPRARRHGHRAIGGRRVRCVCRWAIRHHGRRRSTTPLAVHPDPAIDQLRSRDPLPVP